MNSITAIETSYERMSETEQVIADYVLGHKDEVINANIHRMAESLHISAASISRFVKKYCDKTFAEVKIDLAASNYDESSYNRSKEIFGWTDSLDQLPLNLIESISKVCYDVLAVNQAELFQTAVKWINEAESVFFFGLGSSGVVINDFQQKLMRLEKRCVYNVDSNFGVLNSRIVSAKDVVIAISFSGRTKEVLLAVEEAKKSGVKIIVITRNAPNPLEAMADLKLLVPSAEFNATRLSSIFSRYGQLFIVDILFLSLARLSTDSVESFVAQYRDLLETLKI